MTSSDSTLQIEKKKKSGTGVPNALLKIGKVIITTDAEAQFASVENGTTYGYTISAMYSHTTGPSVRPKLAM